MIISEREWKVLDALWQTQGAELGVIVDILFPETKWSKNTVHTYLTRMQDKGLVRIDKESVPHKYYPLLDKESCRKEERRSFLKKVYGGSAGELIAAFLKEEPISSEEIEKLKKILNDMEV